MRKGFEKKYESKIPHKPFPSDLEGQKAALQENEQLKAYAAYRKKMREQPYEPSYHFSAPDGMINDPNGLCYWNGKYHLFYQAYPPADPRQHWGHAVSTDMVHWQDLPLAIYPDIEYAVFSGSSFVEENRVIAMYHGRGVGNMIATSSDPLLLNWEKNENCPVIPLTPDSHDGKPYRVFDPFLWKEEEGYYALSGCYYGEEDARHNGYNNQMVEHLFFSQNLSRWTYLGELSACGFPQIEAGNDGACPYFWPIGQNGKRILFTFSHRSGPHCIIGDYDPVLHKFYPDKHIRLNFGPVGCSSFQAPCATPDGNGGIYLIHNTKDANRTLVRKGCMTVMWHVTLDADGEICMNPVKQIETLHNDRHFEQQAFTLQAFSEWLVPFQGRELDIRMTVDLQQAHGLEFCVLRSPDAREYTKVSLYRSRMIRGGDLDEHAYVTVDTAHSSLSPDIEGRIPESAEIRDYKPGQKFEVRILVDRCILEVFVNGKAAIMQMMYPTLPNSTEITLQALGGSALVDSIEVWGMNSIY